MDLAAHPSPFLALKEFPMQRRLIVRLAAAAVVPAALGAGLAVAMMPAQERPPTRTPDAATPKRAEPPARPGVPHAAPSRVTQVTVYQNSALVTRQVDVPDGAGTFELVVTPLPQTVSGSLYSEGTDGLRVLTTRFRTRPVQEDTREEVRKLEARLKEHAQAAEKIQADIEAIKQNQQLLGKLEIFTAATTEKATEKATLNGETVIALTKPLALAGFRRGCRDRPGRLASLALGRGDQDGAKTAQGEGRHRAAADRARPSCCETRGATDFCPRSSAPRINRPPHGSPATRGPWGKATCQAKRQITTLHHTPGPAALTPCPPPRPLPHLLPRPPAPGRGPLVRCPPRAGTWR
jgi:hypothetical protein